MIDNKEFSVPNLCKNTSVLVAMLVTQVIIIIFQLVTDEQDWFSTLGFRSLYIQWMLLLSMLVLCKIRNYVNQLPNMGTLLASLAAVLIVFILVETSAQYISASRLNDPWEPAESIRRSLATLLVFALTARFFGIINLLNLRAQSEIQSRIEALQSRIKPHFLFNSLNAISELIHSQPKAAEQALESLSDLFRASLSDTGHTHTLEQEIALCRQYLELEQWRMGDRLSVEWNIADDLTQAEVPTLMLQPLIENAVVHGIQPSVEGGQINITAKTLGRRRFEININNTVSGRASKPGHGYALENLRQRLSAIYDDQFTFEIDPDRQGVYHVSLLLPLNPSAADKI